MAPIVKTPPAALDSGAEDDSQESKSAPEGSYLSEQDYFTAVNPNAPTYGFVRSFSTLVPLQQVTGKNKVISLHFQSCHVKTN